MDPNDQNQQQTVGGTVPSDRPYGADPVQQPSFQQSSEPQVQGTQDMSVNSHPAVGPEPIPGSSEQEVPVAPPPAPSYSQSPSPAEEVNLGATGGQVNPEAPSTAGQTVGDTQTGGENNNPPQGI